MWLAVAARAVGAADLVVHPLAEENYDLVRQTLIEAIEGEGLLPGPVSPFAAMLRRTDADLGHGGDIYAQAEIFSFCSVVVAARLVRENPDRLADCPLSIALYQSKGRRGEIRLVFRRREGDTPGARAANDLLQRIAARTLSPFRAGNPD